MRREAAVALVAARLGVIKGRRGAVDASIEEKQEGEQQARRTWGGTVGRKGHVVGAFWLELAIPDFPTENHGGNKKSIADTYDPRPPMWLGGFFAVLTFVTLAKVWLFSL